MTLTRSNTCVETVRAHKLRRMGGYEMRMSAVMEGKTGYRGELRRKPAKSIKSAAIAFLNPKKEWSIFVYHSIIDQHLETEFNSLAKQWREDTLYYSSLTDICFHPAYQTIMAMGREALPFVFRELEKQPDHWFYALKFMVREDVAKGAVNLAEARLRWLDWARREKYLS